MTELWAEVMPLLWRQELGELHPPGRATALSGDETDTMPGPSTSDLEKALDVFSAFTPEAVLRGAAALVKHHASDSVALVGAADVLTVVAALRAGLDPLREYTTGRLNHRYLNRLDQSRIGPGAAAQEVLRRRYLEVRSVRDSEVTSDPAAVAFRLYEQALPRDPDGTLPALRLRLSLLRVAIDREGARPLLEELRGREPRNAVVPLEQARAAFLLDDDPAAALNFLRDASRLPEFSRSYLVAVPAPLRLALKFERRLRQVVKEGWRGYDWLFTTRMDLESSQVAASPEWKLDAQQAAAAEREIPWLRLKLSSLLCQAPDYADQAVGIDQKARALSALLDQPRLIPPEQRELLALQREGHRRAFAAFPRTPAFLILDGTGVWYLGTPNPRAEGAWAGSEGPSLWTNPKGIVLFPKPPRPMGGPG